jgi:hypothetical protein
MARPLAVVLALVLVAALAPAAPRPKERPGPAPYYATRVGDRLVYDDRGRDRTWEVTAVEDEDGETVVTVSEVTDTRTFPLEKVVVSARGLRRIELGRFKIDPWVGLKTPVQPGDSWDVHMDSQPGLQGATGTMTVGKEEEVETPAGKFRAVPVEGNLTPWTRRASRWVCRNGTRGGSLQALAWSRWPTRTERPKASRRSPRAQSPQPRRTDRTPATNKQTGQAADLPPGCPQAGTRSQWR